MKMTLCLLVVAALCVGLAQDMNCSAPKAKPIKIKMFKTDQKTWGKAWTYGFSADDIRMPLKMNTFKKDTTVSIDPANLSANRFLHVVTSEPGQGGTGATLDISKVADEISQGNVIAIDKNGKPTFKRLTMTQSEIAATKTGKIPVYKVGDVIQVVPWKIRSVESIQFGNQTADQVDEIAVAKNKLPAQKLTIPINRQFFIVVFGPHSTPQESLIPKLPLIDVKKHVLAIDKEGKASIVDKEKIKSMLPQKK